MELPKRKPTRLKEYEYSSPGAYFITICIKGYEHLLSQIIVGEGLAPPVAKLTKYGKVAKEQIENLTQRYPNVTIDKYVIMPNHIHLLISSHDNTGGASPSPTITDVICLFKSIATILCRKNGLKQEQLFQRSFHDHIIRGEEDYLKIWEYIDNNPAIWTNDVFIENMKRTLGNPRFFPISHQFRISQSLLPWFP